MADFVTRIKRIVADQQAQEQRPGRRHRRSRRRAQGPSRVRPSRWAEKS